VGLYVESVSQVWFESAHGRAVHSCSGPASICLHSHAIKLAHNLTPWLWSLTCVPLQLGSHPFFARMRGINLGAIPGVSKVCECS